ncbi:uncharacterized protein ACA1_092420 [Acanthamoeba castellanii str. Neff]|uniref:Uncharacterized protein n=1 Tax=Acanthamoeba castellanii (strain ATCC 30010 / Neff) TaxID=1257118 RepID=L8GIB9_ACACF|nr:uncharacterized protein ACA1_092420 [Acanthamoeba castellanii str. Neff]ELR12722.1 hypothetical protein ACA1_092420 [Acanthamoeba castellanii str. Neff]
MELRWWALLACIHSWDDLDEWHQALRKSHGLSGDKWFKIDPHFMPPEFCASQSRVPHGDSRGCFVLSHDTPSAQAQYNSTQDVALMLQDPTFLPFFTQDQRVYIALCFKNAPTMCDNSTVAQAWLSLVDEFMAHLASTVHKYRLNVEFVLDGDAAPLLERPCLWQRWRPLASTWIDLPWEALFYANPEFAYDRFQVLNLPVSPIYEPGINFDVLSYVGYGRFAASKYPFLCWEPSDQAILTSVVNTYIGGKIIRPEGFRFAINIDPVQCRLPPSLHASSNFVNVGAEALTPTIVLCGSALALTPPEAPRDVGFHSLVFSETALGQSYQLFSHPAAFAEPRLRAEGRLPSGLLGPALASASSAAAASAANASALVLVADAADRFAFFAASVGSPTLGLLANGSFAANGSTTTFAAALAPLGGQSTTFIVARAYASSACALGLEALVADSSRLDHLKPYGSGVCVVGRGAVTSASVAVLPANATSASYCGAAAVAVGVLAFATADKQISHAALCLSSGGRLAIVGPVVVDVGSSPSVSLGLQNGRPVVLEVHGEGYCYNSETKNKRPFPRVCASTPSSTPLTLVYNYGTLDAWFAHLVAQKAGSVAWITSCDRGITHGVYDMGSSPSATLFNSGPGRGRRGGR